MGTTTRMDAVTTRVDVLLQQASMDWVNPSGTEVAVTGAFISGQGGQIHHGLGGSSQLNVDKRKYEAFKPYLQLEQALNFYIPNALDIQEPSPTWDALSEKIGRMEKQYGDTKTGLWHSLWYKMGENQETADAWIAFIPDDYGLGVVKAGIALVFKLAESSVEKRKMIFDTFAALRDCLIQAHPERRSFRTHQKVNECVDRLYEAVVESIQDLAALLMSDGRSLRNRFVAKFKRQKDAPLPTTEDILAKLKERTKDFQDALQAARDRAIDGVDMMSRATGIRAVLIHKDVLETKEHAEYIKAGIDQNAQDVSYIKKGFDRATNEFSHVKAGVDRNSREITHLRAGVDRYTTAVEQAGGQVMTRLRDNRDQMNRRFDQEAAVRQKEHEENQQGHRNLCDMMIHEFGAIKKLVAESQIGRRERGVQQRQERLKTQMLNMLLEKKMMEAKIVELKGQLKAQAQQAPKAVVSLERFCEILAQAVTGPRDDDEDDDEPPDLVEMFQHPARDLRQALAEQCTCSLTSQGQVQSLLTHKQFVEWLNRGHPGLILVDANIEDAALESLSVISVFCATFITSMMEVNPDDLVIQYFCGLHFSPSSPWHGPNGLVRSLIMQLLMKLVAMDRDMTSWNLDFINDRHYLEDLEHHDLDSLCRTLHSLLHQFPADMSIYCIVDSISAFNVDRLFDDLSMVLDCLGQIVDDRSLAPIFKVLLTNPAESTLRIKQLPFIRDNPSRLISLSECSCDPTEISTRVVEDQLLRTPSPLPGLKKRRSHSPLPPMGNRRSLSPLPPPLRHGRSHSSLLPGGKQRARSPLPLLRRKREEVRVMTKELRVGSEDEFEEGLEGGTW